MLLCNCNDVLNNTAYIFLYIMLFLYQLTIMKSLRKNTRDPNPDDIKTTIFCQNEKTHAKILYFEI